MRNWEVRANGPVDDFGYSEPYEAGEAIRRYCAAHQDATEAEIEAIARRYKCSIHWMLPPHAVSHELEAKELAQIQLPSPADLDPHPRLLVNGEGLHAGMRLTALLPDGWHDIGLEVDWNITGPGCWYISTPGYEGICPIGLFVKW